MPIMIQTAGTWTPSRAYIKGPDAPPNALVLRVKHLPNPYAHVQSATSMSERIKAVREFLMDACPDKVDRLVEKGRLAIEKGIPVVIVCVYGRDRSRAIAEMIGEKFHCSRVYYVHRENWKS